MLLTAARWAHLSCSTYPLLLTPLTTGSWPTFSIGASIFGGDVLAWFVSYFDDRTQVVTVGRHTSLASSLSTGVSQGSVLGPRSYVIYADNAQDIFEFQRVMSHLFADDMEGHVSAKPRNPRLITSNIQECTAAVSSW